MGAAEAIGARESRTAAQKVWYLLKIVIIAELIKALTCKRVPIQRQGVTRGLYVMAFDRGPLLPLSLWVAVDIHPTSLNSLPT
jgi:hypothetical protein